MKVIIVGAGIAGLATALRLQRSGHQVLVIERAAQRRTGGYLVNLLGVGYDAVQNLGILTELSQRELGFFNSVLVRANGSEKLTLSAEFTQAAIGPNAITVFRGDLEYTLYNAVENKVDFRFGNSVESIDQHPDHVRVRLSDGTTETCDLLVGADGLHSTVRKLVFGPEQRYRVDLQHVVAAFNLNYPPRGLASATSTTFIGPRRTAAVINLGASRLSAFFAYRCDEPEAELGKGAVASLTARFGDLRGNVPDVLEQLRGNEGTAYFDSVSQIKMDTWSAGRVVLVGDSAWCVSLFAGYGAAMAMAGADTLGEALERHGDLATGLAEWEAKLRPEILQRQAQARKGTAQFAPPSWFHVWMRDLALRVFMLSVVRNLFARLMQRAMQRSSKQ